MTYRGSGFPELSVGWFILYLSTSNGKGTLWRKHVCWSSEFISTSGLRKALTLEKQRPLLLKPDFSNLKKSLKWQQGYISCYKEPAKNKAKNKVSWRKHHQNSFCNSPSKSPGEVLAAPALVGFHIPLEENGWSIICERLVLANPQAGFACPGGMKCMLTPLIQLSKGQVAQLNLVRKVGLKLVPTFASTHWAPHFVALAQGARGRHSSCWEKKLWSFVWPYTKLMFMSWSS